LIEEENHRRIRVAEKIATHRAAPGCLLAFRIVYIAKSRDMA
jgi:hypothetical protein